MIMTESPARDVTTIPRIKHAEAMRIAAVENRKFAEQLASRLEARSAVGFEPLRDDFPR